MGSRNGHPRTALQLVSSVACASSLGGLALLAEERRRRITFAQKIIENGKRLQAHKTYQIAAPLEVFDLGEAWDVQLPNLPQNREDSIPSRNQFAPTGSEQKALSNNEWRSKKRIHRVIPTSTIVTQPLSTSRVSTTNHHWVIDHRSTTTTQVHQDTGLSQTAHISSNLLEPSHLPTRSLPQNFQSSLQPLPNHHNSFPSAEPLVESSSSGELQAASKLEADQGTSVRISPEEHGTKHSQLRYAEYLEDVVAERVINCINQGDIIWVRRGLKELRSYFRRPTPVIGARMREAMKLANNKAPEKLQKKLMALLAAKSRGTCATSLAPPAEFNTFDQATSATHLSSLLVAKKVHEAFFVFLEMCDGLLEPLEKMTMAAVRQLILAFQEVGLFSVVNEIQQMTLFAMKQWKFILHDYSAMMKYNASNPEATSKILREILALDLDEMERIKTLGIFVDCMKWLETHHSLEAAINMHVGCLRDAKLDIRQRLNNLTSDLLRKAHLAGLRHLSSNLEQVVARSKDDVEATPSDIQAHGQEENPGILADEILALPRKTAQHHLCMLRCALEGDLEGTSERDCLELIQNMLFSGLRAKDLDLRVFRWLLQRGYYNDCDRIVLRADNRTERNAPAAVSMINQLTEVLVTSANVLEVGKQASPQRSSLTLLVRRLSDISLAHRRVRSCEQLQKFATNHNISVNSLWENLVQMKYAEGRFDDVEALAESLASLENLNASCRAIVEHCRHRRDAAALSERAKSITFDFTTLPIPFLERLANDVTKAVPIDVAVRSVKALLKKYSYQKDHSSILALQQNKPDLLKAAGPESIAIAYDAFARVGRVVDAVDFLTHQPGPWSSTQVQNMHRHLIIRCWTTTRNIDLTKTIFNKQISLVKEHMRKVKLYNAILMACVESNDIVAAQAYADELVHKLGLKPDMETYSHLLLVVSRAGDWQSFEARISALSQRGMLQSEDSAKLNRCFVVFAHTHTGIETAEYIQHIFDTYSLQVTEIAARLVIEKLSREQDEYQLKKWLVYLKKKNIQGGLSLSTFGLTIFRIIQSNKLKFDEALLSLRSEDLERITNLDFFVQLLDAVVDRLRKQQGEASSIPIPKLTSPEPLTNRLVKLSNSPIKVVTSTPDLLRKTSRRMTSSIALGRPEEALQIYKASLRNGLPSYEGDLNMAIRAISKLQMNPTERVGLAKGLIDSAVESGLCLRKAATSLAILKIQLDVLQPTESQAIEILKHFYDNVDSTKWQLQNPHLAIALAHSALKRGSPRIAIKIMRYAHDRSKGAPTPFPLPAWSMTLQALLWNDDEKGIRTVVSSILADDLWIDRRIVSLLKNGKKKSEKLSEADRAAWAWQQISAAQSREMSDVLKWASETLEMRRKEQVERSIKFARESTRMMAYGERERWIEGLEAKSRERE